MRGVTCAMPTASWRVGLACYFLSSLGLLWTACSAVLSTEGVELAVLYQQQPLLQSIRHPEWLAFDVSALARRLLQSELGLFITLNFCVSLYAMMALLTTVVFLDRLSARESTRLTERLIKYVVFKLIFVSAVVTPDLAEVTLWIVWFALVGFMRIFVGAAKDRLEALMATPSASSSAHARTLALLLAMLGTDVLGSCLLWFGTGNTQKLLLFGFDAAVIACEGLKTLLRYGVHLLDSSLAAAHSASTANGSATAAAPHRLALWESWEGKGAFLYQTELFADVAIHLLTLAHYSHILWLHGLSFHLVDALLFLDMRSVLMQTFRRLRAHVHYCAATHNLNHTFPDACAEELEAMDDDCAICRDRMQAAKQLPCGHLFHLGCLRAWLQQSGLEFTCPICRTPLFLTAAGKPPVPGHATPANAATGPQQQHQQQQQQHRAAMDAAVPRWPLSVAALLRLMSATAGPGAFAGAGAAAGGQQQLEQQLHAALVFEGLPPTEARNLTNLFAIATHASSEGQSSQLPGSHGAGGTDTGGSSSFTSGDPLDRHTSHSGGTSSADDDVLASMDADETDDEDILRSDTRGRRRRRTVNTSMQQEQHQQQEQQEAQWQGPHWQQQQPRDQVESPSAGFPGAGPLQHGPRTRLPAPAAELQTWSSQQLPRVLSTVAQAVSSSLRRTQSDAARRSHGRQGAAGSGQQQQEEEEDEEDGQEVDSRPMHDQGGRLQRQRRTAAAVMRRGQEAGRATGKDTGCSSGSDMGRDGSDDEQQEQRVKHHYSTRAAARAQGLSS